MTDFDFVVTDNIVERVNQMDEFEMDIALRAMRNRLCKLRNNSSGNIDTKSCKGCPWPSVMCLVINDYLNNKHIKF